MAIDFDLDYWLSLAERDPEGFERERKELIRSFIAEQEAKSRKGLKKMQWRVDSVRLVSSNPLASCLRIYQMLMEKTYGDNGFVETLTALNILTDDYPFPERDDPPNGNGKLLPFRNVQKGGKFSPA